MHPPTTGGSAAPTIRPPAAWRVWENPIFRRYCRSRLRARGLFSWMLIAVILAGFFYLIVPMGAERSQEMRLRAVQHMREELARLENPAIQTGAAGWQLRQQKQHIESYRMMIEEQEKRLGSAPPAESHQRMAIIPLLILQSLLLFVLGTGQVAGGMTSERDDGMVDYQRLTPMTPLAKVLGYLFGLPVREWVLFLSTLPFTALALWRGKVPLETWGPVALIFFTSVILYHCTGLVAGTVLKNRRWAFILCMVLIFVLYTAVPQGARLGLPFLKYVTMWPAVMEAAHIFPDNLMRDWRMFSGHTGGRGVEFFQMRMSDVAFTLVVQGCFIVTMLVMVWRKWLRAESHLLSKVWALILFGWVGVLCMGTVLPGIGDGSVFPETSMSRMQRAGDMVSPLNPSLGGAAAICGVYAVFMFLFLLLLVVMVTPGQDGQARGLRRAQKLGGTSAPWHADESSSLRLVLVLVVLGAAGCTWFTRAVLGSDWFPGADPGWKALGVFLAVLAPPLVAFHGMLESRGGKWPFLSVVLLGVVPVLAALVMAAASRRDQPVMAAFVAGASPFVLPAYGVEQLLPHGTIPDQARPTEGAVASALKCWPIIYGVAAFAALRQLRSHWRQRKAGK